LAGAAGAAADLLQAWLGGHSDDSSAALLLDQALEAAQRTVDLDRRWSDQAEQRYAVSGTASLWTRWLRARFGLTEARELADAVVSSEDRRLVWTSTLLAAREPQSRFEAAQSLLAESPEDLRLQAIIEAVVVGPDRREDRLRLGSARIRDLAGLDRDYLLHRLAQDYLELERPSDALALWTKLGELRPDFIPATLGRWQCLRQLGHAEQAQRLSAQVEAQTGLPADAHPLEWDRLLASHSEAAGAELAALVALVRSDRAEALADPGAARRRAQRALSLAPDFRAAARKVVRLGQSDLNVPEQLRAEARLVGGLMGLEADPEQAQAACLAALSEAAPAGGSPEAVAGLLVLGAGRDRPALLVEAARDWAHFCRDADLLLQLELQAARAAELGGHPRAALECYERAWSRRPDDAWIGYHVARLAARLDDLGPERREAVAALAGQGAPACPALYALASRGEPRQRAQILGLLLDLDASFLPAEWELLCLDRSAVADGVLARRGRRRGCARLLVEVGQRALAQGDQKPANRSTTRPSRWPVKRCGRHSAARMTASSACSASRGAVSSSSPWVRTWSTRSAAQPCAAACWRPPSASRWSPARADPWPAPPSCSSSR